MRENTKAAEQEVNSLVSSMEGRIEEVKSKPKHLAKITQRCASCDVEHEQEQCCLLECGHYVGLACLKAYAEDTGNV